MSLNMITNKQHLGTGNIPKTDNKMQCNVGVVTNSPGIRTYYSQLAGHSKIEL